MLPTGFKEDIFDFLLTELTINKAAYLLYLLATMDVEAQLEIWKTFAIPTTLLHISNILLNSFLIHALRKLKKLKTISFKFILLLSISDICDGVTTVNTNVMLYVFSADQKRLRVILGFIFKYSFALFSFIMIFIIAIDRYIHLRYLSKYSTIMTNRRAIIMVAVGVFSVASHTAVLICARLFGFFPNVQVYLSIFILMCFITIFALYINSYRELKQVAEKMNLDKSLPVAAPSNDASREVSKGNSSIRKNARSWQTTANSNGISKEVPIIIAQSTDARKEVLIFTAQRTDASKELSTLTASRRDTSKVVPTITAQSTDTHKEVPTIIVQRRDTSKEVPTIIAQSTDAREEVLTIIAQRRNTSKEAPRITASGIDISREVSVMNTANINSAREGKTNYSNREEASRKVPRITAWRRSASREVFKSVFFVITALLICYTPYCVTGAIRHTQYYGAKHQGLTYIESISVCLVAANGSLNALILLLLNRDLKSFTADFFRFHFCRERVYLNFHSRLRTSIFPTPK